MKNLKIMVDGLKAVTPDAFKAKAIEKLPSLGQAVLFEAVIFAVKCAKDVAVEATDNLTK